jgi:hypothetical protein
VLIKDRTMYWYKNTLLWGRDLSERLSVIV